MNTQHDNSVDVAILQQVNLLLPLLLLIAIDGAILCGDACRSFLSLSAGR